MKPIILVDIDGTIALRGDRPPHDHDSSMEDAVNWPIVRICDALYKSGQYDVMLMSGRQEKYRAVTEYWLFRQEILQYRLDLLMRKTGDERSDAEVKRELFERHPYLRRRVWAVFDDRNPVVSMWRSLGLTCLQVAEGDF